MKDLNNCFIFIVHFESTISVLIDEQLAIFLNIWCSLIWYWWQIFHQFACQNLQWNLKLIIVSLDLSVPALHTLFCSDRFWLSLLHLFYSIVIRHFRGVVFDYNMNGQNICLLLQTSYYALSLNKFLFKIMGILYFKVFTIQLWRYTVMLWTIGGVL